jgi:hypothetical protein
VSLKALLPLWKLKSFKLLPFLKRAMKIQGHLRDYPLHDLLEILANRRETGCLRIEFEPEPALFYFNRGQLVDARMSFLKGFPAVHLAFSRAEAAFDFDNQIAPPEAAIIDENERALLSGILKLQLDGDIKVETPPPALSNSAAILARQFSISDEPKPPAVEPPAPRVKSVLPLTQEVAKTAPARESAVIVTEEAKTEELNATVFAKVIEPAAMQVRRMAPFKDKVDLLLRETWAKFDPLLRETWTRTSPLRASVITLSKDLSKDPAKQRLLRIAALVFVIAIPATIGITVLLGKKNAAEQVLVASTQESNATAAKATQAAVTPKSLQPATNEAPPVQAPLQNHTPVVTQTPASLAANTKAVTKLPEPETPKVIEERSAQTQPAETPKPIEQPTTLAESTSKTIVVVVHVEDGRVTEAWVKDSRKGLEAYEATAIRLARQRRYPAGASRTESVPVSVSINK